jgi:hypothetical protein
LSPTLTFAHLGYKNLDLHDDTGFQLVTILAAKDFDAHDFAVFTIAHAL